MELLQAGFSCFIQWPFTAIPDRSSVLSRCLEPFVVPTGHTFPAPALTWAVGSNSLQTLTSLPLPRWQQRSWDEHRLYSFQAIFLRIDLSPEIVITTSCHPVQCRKNFLPSRRVMYVNMFLTAVCFTLNIQRGVKLKGMNKDRKALYL